MALGPPAQQLEALFDEGAPFEGACWVALAAEERLGESALLALGCSHAALARVLASGAVFAAGQVRSLEMRKSGLDEPAFALATELRELVLRRAHARGELASVAVKSRELLGRRSVSALAVKLQDGSLRLRPDAASPSDPSVERRLRESLTRPFDAAWLERTWTDQAPAVVARVLSQALPGLEDCRELSEWASRSTLRERDERGVLASVLVEHALHGGHWDEAEILATSLSAAERQAFAAVAKLLQGERVAARTLLERSLVFSAAKLPAARHWTPLLALLLLHDKTEESIALAKKWLGSRAGPPESRGPARALKLLIRYGGDPDVRFTRIDAHQLAPEASAWELLILGLTVQTYLDQPGTRASWSELLGRFALEWAERGFVWMSRQAHLLAMDLGSGGRAEPRLPSDLSRLVEAESTWERGLAALDRVAIEVAVPSTTFRLEWFVNMVDGSLHKPGLQEFRTGRGWSTSDRLSRAEAEGLLPKLPLEDRRVLEAEHALEALIGHPRVVNGARGASPVEVVRGECRLETRDEAGFLTIELIPPGLRPGVNVLVEGENRLVVIRVSPAMEKVMEVVPSELMVPVQHAARALSVLGKLSEGIVVKSVHLGGSVNIDANSVPCLRISPVAGAWLVQAGVRPFGARGRFFVIDTGPVAAMTWFEGRRLRTERNHAEESRRVHELIRACPSLLSGWLDETPAQAPGESRECWSFGGDALLELLVELRASGLAIEFEWPASAPVALRGSVSMQSLKGSLKAKKGWYLASGSIPIDEVTALTLAELSSLPSVAAGRFVRLPGGDYVEIEARVRRVLLALRAGAVPNRATNELRLHGSNIHALRLLAEAPGIDLDAEARAELERFARTERLPRDKPALLRAELRSYQLAGFRWLCSLGELGLGACLADDMGLGKTLQILAFLLTRPVGSRALVVAPTSVCTNWLREIEKFAPSLLAREYVGAGRAELLAASGPPIVIVSYGLLHEDSERLAELEWDTVVLDEAQFIKNPASQRARAAFSLRARHRIAATGTPVENHLGDLWSIFRFLNPELLGSWESFQTFFAKPIEREGSDAVQLSLRQIVKPYILRRMKSEVLGDLPELTTVRHEVQLSREESLRYGLLRRQIHVKLRTVAGKQQNKLEVLAEITRLRRFCCHPRLVFPDASQDSQKLDAFLELVRELHENDHRALVFSQYVDFLAIVRERLDEAGVPYEYLDGSTPKAVRQHSIDSFQSGKKPLFLISLKAGGLGLNLTAADYVIHLDPWWNPAVEAQATDRAHRMGQTRPVTVYEFVTRDTIEEDILQLHRTKQGLADALLEGSAGAARLSAAELLTWLEESHEKRGETGLIA